MNMKIKISSKFLSILLCLALMLTYVPLSSLTAFATDGGAITAGDFTIAPTDGTTTLTDGTDYTYADGKLTITTTIPVTVGMKDGVVKTAEIIETDSTNGEAAITFNNINIETTEDEAITVIGSDKTTLYFSGTNNIVSADTGIDVSSKTPLNITSTDEGSLNISGVKYGIACIAYSTTEMLEITGNINIDISGCTMHAIYYRKGAVSISGTPVINIDTAEYAIYGIGIDISGGTFTVKNDDGYAICSGSGNPLALSGQADVHITEGDNGLYTKGGKITITDSVKPKIYGGNADNKTAAILEYAISSDELLIDKNATVDVFTQEYAIAGGITKISDYAQVSIKVNSQASGSRYAIMFDTPLDICGNAKVDIAISGSKVYGLYDSDGTVNISDQAVVTIDGAYRSIYADYLNLSGNSSLTITNDLNYAIYGVTTIQDSAKLTATSTDKKVLYDEFTVKPSEGKAYMVKTGSSEADATTDYYTAETTKSEKSSWKYFHAEPTDTVPVTITFDPNGGEAIGPITVNFNEKYGRLPSSAVTGLSGGDSNWYLVDENGNVTETKISRLTNVTLTRDHTLFVKREVLAPILRIALEVPGAISDGYQYYVPGNSKRILTVTVNNQNTDILDYTYQWYKDGVAIASATEATLTLDGSVADSGTYKVEVTATLKDGTGIIVTSNTASAEKEQKVKIMRAANTLYYDANEGEGGPSSNYTGGTTITVENGEPTRTGYVFGGWNTKADGTGESYDGGSTYTFAEDNGNGGCSVTLYAQWVKAYGVYVGGVQVTETNKDDVLGDGKVSYDAETNTLTLNGWSYEGEGYRYGSYEDETSGVKEFYSAAIYSEGSITIKLEGSNTLKNSFNDSEKEQYGDGVVVEGSVTFIGDGNLSIFGSYAIDANEDVTIDGSTVHMQTTNDGIGAIDGDVIIKNNADVNITAKGDGIYAGGGVTITDSIVAIDAGEDGIYAYDGSVTIGSTKTGLSVYGPWLDGTKVSIKVDGKYGIFAYKGLTVDKKLTISAPVGGQVGEMTAKDYTYGTVVVGETVAKDIVIEPLGYTVTISGLSTDMGALVPVGQSVNEAYCEMYEVEDFSEILEIEKDGYIFGGWYTDEACTDGNEFDFDSPVTADITIYAKWTPIYTIVVEKTEGGDVTVSPETVTKGETVVITPKPDDGKEVDTVTVIDKGGESIIVTKNDDGTYSFTQPESEVTVKVTYKDKQTGTTDGDTGKDENKPSDSPQTGDNSNLWLWFALLFISGGAIFGIILTERKRRMTTKR